MHTLSQPGRQGRGILPDFLLLLLLLGFRSDLEREKFISSSCTTEGTQKTGQLLAQAMHNTTQHAAYRVTSRTTVLLDIWSLSVLTQGVIVTRKVPKYVNRLS